MVWTVLGPLSAHIKEALRLSDQQTGLMVAVPSLGGAALRIGLGLLVDRIGAKNTGILAQSIVIAGLAWAWLAGLGSYQAVLFMGFILGFAGRVSPSRCRKQVAGTRRRCKARCSDWPALEISAWCWTLSSRRGWRTLTAGRRCSAWR